MLPLVELPLQSLLLNKIFDQIQDQIVDLLKHYQHARIHYLLQQNSQYLLLTEYEITLVYK